MDVKTDRIADGIYRFSVHVPQIAAPAGFGFNQYLVDATEPLLFHCGPRNMFDAVSSAFSRIMPIARLRWISFGHVESDECGSMNQWLAAAPQAQVVHGATACLVSLNDLADRSPRILGDNEVLELGGKRVRWLDTPHVPHAWESGLMFEESTKTLFCGDLFTHTGQGPALVKESIVPRAIAAEDMFRSTSLTPGTAPTIRRLAALKPHTLAVMHGSCFSGDCAQELAALADYYQASLNSAARS